MIRSMAENLFILIKDEDVASEVILFRGNFVLRQRYYAEDERNALY